jgi:hypothetical protein
MLAASCISQTLHNTPVEAHCKGRQIGWASPVNQRSKALDRAIQTPMAMAKAST